jgi:hypothetical protein
MQLIIAQNTEHQTNLIVIISEEVLAQMSVIKPTLIHITYYICILVCCEITFFVGPAGVVIGVASLQHQISKCSPTLSVDFFNLCT